jgi:hypothetical protein
MAIERCDSVAPAAVRIRFVRLSGAAAASLPCDGCGGFTDLTSEENLGAIQGAQQDRSTSRPTKVDRA